MLPRQRLNPTFIHDGCQPLDDEKQVTLEQAYRDGRTNSAEDAKPGCIGNRLFLASLVLLGLPLRLAAVVRCGSG
jgi:hypothetical protein